MADKEYTQFTADMAQDRQRIEQWMQKNGLLEGEPRTPNIDVYLSELAEWEAEYDARIEGAAKKAREPTDQALDFQFSWRWVLSLLVRALSELLSATARCGMK